MRRVFDLDVLACPRCHARLRVIATDPAPVQAILAHRGPSTNPFQRISSREASPDRTSIFIGLEVPLAPPR